MRKISSRSARWIHEVRILFAKWFSHFAKWFEHHQENQVFTKWIFTMWTSPRCLDPYRGIYMHFMTILSNYDPSRYSGPWAGQTCIYRRNSIILVKQLDLNYVGSIWTMLAQLFWVICILFFILFCFWIHVRVYDARVLWVPTDLVYFILTTKPDNDNKIDFITLIQDSFNWNESWRVE